MARSVVVVVDVDVPPIKRPRTAAERTRARVPTSPRNIFFSGACDKIIIIIYTIICLIIIILSASAAIAVPCALVRYRCAGRRRDRDNNFYINSSCRVPV